MTRLNETTMKLLPAKVRRPHHDRARSGIGIVHLGIGAFHRAHQAVYTDDALALEGGDWSIAGASLRGQSVHDQLAPQDCLFTVTALSGAGSESRVIGAVRDVLFAPGNPAKLIALMAAPSTRIVSLTVTEKGYSRDPASGRLLADDPDIVHDLANPSAPRTAIGYLVRALERRQRLGLPPFTVLSCDNLPDNGQSLRRVVLEFAGLASEPLADWISENVAFPGTMVDRIVPAMTEAGLDRVATSIGCRDEGAIVTEPFTQWVIEDNFPEGRPAWEKVGALLVDDVAPYELIKLRLLNGAHSSLAYLGYLGGLEYVADCMASDPLRGFISALMRAEISDTLTPPAGFGLDAYIDALLDRFANPTLYHRCWQIAMDGSQKLPQRLLGTIGDRLAAGKSVDRLALAVAGWVRYASGTDLNGQAIDVRDPLSEMLQARFSPHLDDPMALTDAALGVDEVFGRDLAANGDFREALFRQLAVLQADGSMRAVARLSVTP